MDKSLAFAPTALALVSLHRRYKTEEVMMTKEEALRRFKAAKQTKKDAVAALEEKMKQAYEERTGLKANYVVTLWKVSLFRQ